MPAKVAGFDGASAPKCSGSVSSFHGLLGSRRTDRGLG